MIEMKKTHKLWQSMINTNLTPDEFLQLSMLGKVRGQSLRELVSNILKQELKAFKDIIEQETNNYTTLLSLGTASKKRSVGRPRLKDASSFTKSAKEATLPASMLDIIEETLRD